MNKHLLQNVHPFLPWQQGGRKTSPKNPHTQPTKCYLPFQWDRPLPKHNYTYISTKAPKPKPRRDYLNILIKIYLANFPSIINAHFMEFTFHTTSHFPFAHNWCHFTCTFYIYIKFVKLTQVHTWASTCLAQILACPEPTIGEHPHSFLLSLHDPKPFFNDKLQVVHYPLLYFIMVLPLRAPLPLWSSQPPTHKTPPLLYSCGNPILIFPQYSNIFFSTLL